jgi:hypothetical protein
VTVLGEVAHFSTVETGSLGARSLVIGLSLEVCGVVVLWLGCVHVGIVALVLASVIRGSSLRQVHWYLDVVVCGMWYVGGVVLWSLLLLLRPLLVLLGSSSPGSWSELVLILSECVVEPSWVGDSSSSPDEFDHLSSFGYVDRSGFVVVVSLWDWELDDFVKYTWG